MNRLNRIFHNKQIKLFWFLRSFARYLTPKRLLQSRLDRVLAEAERRPDWEYICRRADYYNKLSPAPATPPPRRAASVRRPQVPSGRQDGLFLRYLRVHPLVQRPPAVEYRSRGRDDGSRRAVDRQEPADLRRQRQFGAAEPRQGPPFHLPAGRHSVPEEVGQGDFPAGDHAASPPRTFHAHVFRFGVLRCRHLDAPSRISPEWTKPHISMYDHLNYKFILAIEGYDVATNLKWIMSSNSLAVMPRPTYETWFMEGTLIPGYHYVEIRPDYSDLEERMRYYIEHPDEAEAIIAHAHEYVAQFRDRRREKIISLLVLQNYFRRTGQR